jgi:thiamine transporter ThiT
MADVQKVCNCRSAIFLSLPLIALTIGIIDLVLSQVQTSCDNTNGMNLNVQQYLLGQGIVEIILSVIYFFGHSILVFTKDEKPADKEKLIFVWLGLTFIPKIFSIIWFIIGGIIIFKSNTDCINQGATMVIFAIVLWAISYVQGIVTTFVTVSNLDEMTNV